MHDEAPGAAPPYSAAQRARVLVLVSLSAFLVPLTTTIYLPTLSLIETDLRTTSVMVGLTISGYVLLAGLMPLVYGPYADRLGRRKILLISLILYVLTSLLTSRSWDIYSLIGFRTSQAVGVSAAMVVGAGSITDVYPARSRGKAMGMFGVAPLIGPIVGPVLGGLIATAVGWRGLFVALAALGLLALVACSIWLPETLRKDRIPTTPPRPWEPLLLLRDRSLLLLAILGGVAFAAMFATVTLLPLLLAELYGMETMAIGLTFVPFGLASLLGTVSGGIAADRFGRKPNFVLGTLALVPALTLFGFFVETTLTAAVLLLSSIGFLISYSRPALSTYAIERTPRHAGGIMAAVMAVGLVMAAISATVAPALASSIGTGPLFAILSSILAVAAIVAALGTAPDPERIKRPS